MITIYGIKNELRKMGIEFVDRDVGFMQLILKTPQYGNTIRFFFDTEGEFLELSAYTFMIQKKYA